MGKLTKAALLLCVALPQFAIAVPVTWTLENVVFEDSSTASGSSFVFDADTTTYSGISITTTSPSVTYTFLSPSSGSSASGVSFVESLQGDMSGVPVIALSFANPLTDAGGIIDLIGIGKGTCYDFDCSTADGNTFIYLTSGRVTSSSPAVPEPITLALFAVAMAAAGLCRRRCQSPKSR